MGFFRTNKNDVEIAKNTNETKENISKIESDKKVKIVETIVNGITKIAELFINKNK